MNKQNLKVTQKGYSLIELLVVGSIVVLVSTIGLSYFNEIQGSGITVDQLAQQAALRITERKSEAIRLNGEDRRLGLENLPSPRLEINFRNLAETGSLVTDGVDENNDCVDDLTNELITCLEIKDGQAEWASKFRKDGLKLDGNWSIINSTDNKLKMSLIHGGHKGRGVIATKFSFDSDGNAWGFEESGWKSYPTGSPEAKDSTHDEAAFWALYFVNNKTEAGFALAVYPSGFVEKFFYDGSVWLRSDNSEVSNNGK